MPTPLEQLPTLGIGASLSLSAEPDPVRLVQNDNGPAFVEYAGLVDVEQVLEEIERIQQAGAPVLYHPSHINFCGSWPNNAAWLQATARHIERVGSAWFAQDCAYCFWGEEQGYSTQLGYFIPPLFNAASLQLATQRVREVQASMPVPVAVEPPPVCFVAGSMPLFRFFGELAHETGCAILLDMGHLVSWEMASNGHVLDQLEALPCERVIEVHVAGGRIRQGGDGPIYIDAHEEPVLPQTWQMLETLLPLLPAVKALCFECEGVAEDSVMRTLERLRQTVRRHSASRSLAESA